MKRALLCVFLSLCPGGGGAAKNFGVRNFEAKHQDPKQTNTNHKESHLQMVERENYMLGLQFLASGEEWTAYEVQGKFVVREHKVRKAATAAYKTVEGHRKAHRALSLSL